MYQRVGQAAFKKDLTNITTFCKHLHMPHDKFESIHIAGTNGKGTTAHSLAAILHDAGYKTGLYTSPHYVDFRERIKVDGQMIPKNAVVEFVDNNKSFIENVQPSFFEISVAMAFDFFRNEKVDFAVIETGLGGRLDSTNIVKPVLSVITNISLDHQSMLGDTLSAIATEKAGIIKQDTPVVIGRAQDDIHHIFLRQAKKKNADLYEAHDLVRMDYEEKTGFKNKFAYTFRGSRDTNFCIHASGAVFAGKLANSSRCN